MFESNARLFRSYLRMPIGLLVLSGALILGGVLLVLLLIGALLQRWVGIASLLVWLLLLIAAFVLARRLSVHGLVRLLFKLRASLPRTPRECRIASLEQPARAAFDSFGIPSISAHSRADALRVLGYVAARDRLFQLDLLRREAAGRLAEVFGAALLAHDIGKRMLGFRDVAERVVAGLPAGQAEALSAYAEGVNAGIASLRIAPFEFLALGYRPEPWTSVDSILVALAIFDQLSFDYAGERMLTIMEQALPPEVVAFLTPDFDCYSSTLLGGEAARRPAQPIPVQALAALRRAGGPRGAARLVDQTQPLRGSNAWAVGGARTRDGRAILANDIHLRLGVPNVFYRAELAYGDTRVLGVTLPGLPLILAGSNDQIAWGVANLQADCLDLVTLEIDPADPERYRAPDGWRTFVRTSESIGVRGDEACPLELRSTVWGPVIESNLAGRQIALRWSALDPQAIDLGLLDLDSAYTIEEAIAVVTRSGGPPLSVVLADAGGRIGWSVCGRLPLRRGFDGTAARSWADGAIGWDGYIAPDELPRMIDPPEGFLATANNRIVGAGYPHALGHNFGNGYRAHRIAERLRELGRVDERALFTLQGDTVAGFYEFYRALALSVLADSLDPAESNGAPADLAGIRELLAAWDGRAEPESAGILLLVYFREQLAEAVFAPFLEVCRETDDLFAYSWLNIETPLRALLTERPPELLPEPERYASWNAFLRGLLEVCGALLCRRFDAGSVGELRWGAANRAYLAHPLAARIPALRWLLNMPRSPLPGCQYAICVSSPIYGAVLRMVVSPGHHAEGFTHMPCGQSGHPLSPHYDDQHDAWAGRGALAFAPGAAQTTLKQEQRKGTGGH